MNIFSVKYILALSLFLFSSLGAFACEKPSISGKWINPKAKLNELSSLQITYNCDLTKAKSYDPLSSARWIVRGRIQCQRTECILGRAQGVLLGPGSLQSVFKGFSSITQLNISENGSLLRVESVTRYIDHQRKPVRKVHYLKRKN